MKLTNTTITENEFKNVSINEVLENFQKFSKVKTEFRHSGSTVYLFANLEKSDLINWRTDGIQTLKIQIFEFAGNAKANLYIHDAFSHF